MFTTDTFREERKLQQIENTMYLKKKKTFFFKSLHTFKGQSTDQYPNLLCRGIEETAKNSNQN